MNGCEFNLINESGRTVDPDPLRRCAEAVSAGEAGPGTREINLLLCNDAAMKRYHRIYRGSDSVTDVLSFSAAAEVPDGVSEQAAPASHDIVIDTNQIDRQKGTNSFEMELMGVFIHGLLHVFGYDHVRQRDRNIMNQKELHYQELMQGGHRRG